MITEDYVSFETAKLLKEKGFSEKVKAWYVYNPKSYCKITGEEVVDYNPSPIGFSRYGCDANHDETLSDSCCSAPTLQMTMKWLREVYNLFISVYSYPYSYTTHGWSFLIHPIKYTDGLGWNWDDSLEVLINKKNSDDKVYSTYEECCEKAIKHCLENLI